MKTVTQLKLHFATEALTQASQQIKELKKEVEANSDCAYRYRQQAHDLGKALEELKRDNEVLTSRQPLLEALDENTTLRSIISKIKCLAPYEDIHEAWNIIDKSQ
jgi:chromosome segregation ATPase